MQHRLLLVDDDPSISEMVKNYLTKEGFVVLVALNGEDGISMFLKEEFDLILIDIMMPKLDGIEAIKIIREKSSIPILIMSAKDSDVDKAIGLGFGADDYIAKPFSLLELSARIKAAIRRATKYADHHEQTDQKNVLTFDQLKIDLNSYSVFKANQEMKLTSKEFELLKLFITNQNRVFTKEQLYNLVWNDDYFGDENVINVHIRRLREKIEDDPSDPKYIKTLWGIGYKWVGH
ncbi:response regulator transcription factor [Cytobacillus dafuensis]|uniref:Response regulator transcription factor n=1 Tax=Cytobacillus dafuensis TaxID=1742359 RepID=A0A5B8ZC84_CYTDA|nr:response regulator transcription factor [Cytobacillus dafuensis]QED49329.1 response regulator transcription factor [Cytobacillus dafuensis]